MTEFKTQGETKRSPWVKLQTGLLAGILVLLGVLAALVGVTARNLERSMVLVQAELETLEMNRVNEAVAALTEAAEQLAAVDAAGLNETAQSLRAAADSLAQVDVEKLNGAISSLREAADTLKSLDMEALNGVIQSLNKAVAGLQRVSDSISGIFH